MSERRRFWLGLAIIAALWVIGVALVFVLLLFWEIPGTAQGWIVLAQSAAAAVALVVWLERSW